MSAISAIQVEIEHTPATIIVKIRGDATVQTADELERRLRPVAALRPSVLVIDLSDLRFISSFALGLLVELKRGVARNGGTVCFVAPASDVRDVITRCRLDSVLTLHSTIEDALAAASAQPAM